MKSIKRQHLALLAVGLAWLPLAALSLVQTGSPDVPGAASFWRDFGANTRYLIGMPLLVLADGVCIPRLWRLVDHFPRAGLIGDIGRFEAAVASARRALDSRKVLIVLAGAAWLAAATIARSYPTAELPPWHLAIGGSRPYSAAGWWHVLVSIPIALLLLLGWSWRLYVWTRLLHRIARCRLRLIAAHPDRSAGLGFLSGSLAAFAPVAFAFSTIAAGRETQAILSGRALWTGHLYFNLGVAAFIMLMIVLPLCTFTPALLGIAGRGGRAYGALAHQMGQAFERRWLRAEAPRLGEEALQASDFSATVDLYSIVGAARGLRVVPVGRRQLIMLAATLALPFAPVALLMMPLGVIWAHLRELLF